MTQPTDLLTIPDALKVVRRSASNTEHAARVEAYVSAISLRLDELVGPIVQRTITGEQHQGGCRTVRLRRRPVASISAVATWTAGASTAVTAESLNTEGGYLAEPWAEDPTFLSGVLTKRSGWSNSWWDTGSTVVVTYVAGRFEDTEAVKGSRFWQAAALTLKSLWRAEEATTVVVDEYDLPATAIPGFLIPTAARDLLADQIQFTGVA